MVQCMYDAFKASSLHSVMIRTLTSLERGKKYFQVSYITQLTNTVVVNLNPTAQKSDLV